MMRSFEIHAFEARDGQIKASVTAPDGRRSPSTTLDAEELATLMCIVARCHFYELYPIAQDAEFKGEF